MSSHSARSITPEEVDAFLEKCGIESIDRQVIEDIPGIIYVDLLLEPVGKSVSTVVARLYAFGGEQFARVMDTHYGVGAQNLDAVRFQMRAGSTK